MNYWYILLQKVPFQWLAHPLSHMPVNLLQDAPFLQWPGQSTHDLFDMKFPLGHTVIYTHLFTKQVSNKALTALIDLHKFIHLVKHTPPLLFTLNISIFPKLERNRINKGVGYLVKSYLSCFVSLWKKWYIYMYTCTCTLFLYRTYLLPKIKQFSQ